MFLNLFGHQISEAAQRAGEAAIARRRLSFTANQIAPDILPHITPQETCWKEATPERVALAVAQELIWHARREGRLTPGSYVFGTQFWRPVRPVRPGGAG